MKKSIALSLILLSFALGFVFSNAMTTLPKDISTASELCRLEFAIREFVKGKKQLPDSLDSLVHDGYLKQRQILDRWGNRIEYQRTEKGRVLLISRGDANVRNSMGCDYVISKVFEIKVE